MGKDKPCGNSDCSVSTGIHDGLTFGSGKLDNFGYWEKPCSICARDWEEEYQEEGMWPFKSKRRSKMKHCIVYHWQKFQYWKCCWYFKRLDSIVQDSIKFVELDPKSLLQRGKFKPFVEEKK